MVDPVRPTFRVLDELSVAVPTLDVSLHAIGHPLIEKAQAITDELAAGGGDPVLALKDRQWWKVKIKHFRGAATHVPTPSDHRDGVPEIGWWLGAAGHRKNDSPAQDFYAQLEAECRRAGRGTGGISTDHLLPSDTDYRRWHAELATKWVGEVQQAVRHVIAAAATSGAPAVLEVGRFVLRAFVIIDADGISEAYLAFMVEGFTRPEEVAVILASIPGVSPEDWGAEPGDDLGLAPGPGDLVYSTLLDSAGLARILDQVDGTLL